MTDYDKVLAWAQAWNNIVLDTSPGTEVNVMDILAACVTISTAYLLALPPADKEQASKIFLSNLQISLLPSEGSLQ